MPTLKSTHLSNRPGPQQREEEQILVLSSIHTPKPPRQHSLRTSNIHNIIQ